MSAEPYGAVLLDIEGTTTPISFVYDVLFPYAKEQLESYLADHWGDPGLQSDVDALREQARQDQEAGLDAPTIPQAGLSPNDVMVNVRWQMGNVRKTTGLKSLQGRIWKAGYAAGTLRGVTFADVAPALVAWKQAEVPVAIYSSGSVAAQKLLFGHAEAGDLRPLISGYFDTTTGPKKAARSYQLIANALGMAPGRLLFVTDVLAEAVAANEAGLQVSISVRLGNKALAPHDFEEITSFEPLVNRLVESR